MLHVLPPPPSPHSRPPSHSPTPDPWREVLADDLEQITASASHELRDPLREAQQWCAGLAERLGSPAHATLQAVNSQLQHVLDRLTVLRRYGYLAQQQPVQASTHDAVPLEDVLQQAISRCGELVHQTRATITHAALPQVTGDAGWLTDLCERLLDNALRFNASQKPTLHISATREGARWHLRFRDNGIGLEPEYRHYIFGLFRQADPERDGDYFRRFDPPHADGTPRGHGAGLAFARRIATLHGGALVFAPGDIVGGSTFVLSLPVVA